MTSRTNRFAHISMFLSAALVVGMALEATTASAQSRSEVMDPYSAAPTTSHTELLDPFADAPPPVRREPATEAPARATALLDPFATTARRAARYLVELLDPWSD